MSTDPRAQGEKGALPAERTRKTSVFEGGNMPGAVPPGRTGKPAEGDAASSKDSLKEELKIEIPKDNAQPVNPKYSSETPIILNKLPIFDDSETRQS